MTKSTLSSLVMAAALAWGVAIPEASAAGSQDALLNALVRKRVLSESEADEIRGELAQEKAKSSAEKIKLSNSISELKLYGDLRLRYQYDNRDTMVRGPQVTTAGKNGEGDPRHGRQRSRARFRLRLGADFKLTDQFFGGVQIQTSSAADSGNQTFTGGFSNYDLFLSRAYLGWKPMDGLTFVGGKQANPFYTTDLVWDGDINPTGVVEIVDLHKLVASAEGGTPPWELTLTGGQFIFQDNDEDKNGTDYKTDAWLFVTQARGSYKFENDVKLTVAPGFMTYTASDLTSSPGMNNETSFYSTRNLSILTAPGDVSFKMGGLKAKVYWDLAYNLEGSKRARDIYGLDGSFDTNLGRDASTTSTIDNLAWLVGFKLGDNKKKGDWSAMLDYRQTGIAAVDPNLNDSDFALGQLNTQGVKAGVAYNLTDSAIAAVSFIQAWNLREIYGGEATGGSAIANTSSAQIIQVDLNLKF
ncbi:MAG TPA: putative porin [Chthoniobacteraceae bacterium]|nr:putative porin [Chthoniobacteraceae bacterium]